MLAVQLDGATYNNFILLYSVTLNAWQGTWCWDINGVDTAIRDFARDRTNQDETLLIVGTIDGIISQVTYPVQKQYFDQNIDGTQIPYFSSMINRALTFS